MFIVRSVEVGKSATKKTRRRRDTTYPHRHQSLQRKNRRRSRPRSRFLRPSRKKIEVNRQKSEIKGQKSKISDQRPKIREARSERTHEKTKTCQRDGGGIHRAGRNWKRICR